MLLISPRQTGVVEEGFGVRPSNEYMPTIAPDSSAGIFWNNLLDTPSLWLGMIGGYPLGSLGWLDTVMPQIVVFSVFLVAVTLSYLALHDRDWKKITAIIGGVILISAIPLYLLQLGGFLVGEKIQPRYLLPLLIVLMGIIFLPSRTDSRFFLPSALVAAGALLLAIANSAALHTNIRRYVTGITQGGIDLSSGREWWWQSIPAFLTPNTVWVIGSLAFLGFAWNVLNERSRIAQTSANAEAKPAKQRDAQPER
jgi:drug/metabolite transporter (DMT)-like permease